MATDDRSQGPTSTDATGGPTTVRTVLRRSGSASWGDWSPGGTYWPGHVLVGLALAGIAVGRRRRSTRFLVVLAISAFLASMGSELSVFGSRPWTFLVDHVDSISRLRSPFRAAALVQVALVGLAVPALHELWTRRQTLTRAAAPALVLAAVLLTGPGPGPLVDGPPRPGAWAGWLARHPDGGPVAFLPFAPTGAAADFEPTTTRMVQALGTGHPMINGYSGFFPAGQGRRRDDLSGFPDGRSLATLRSAGVRYVVVTTSTFDRFDQRIAAELGLRTLAEDADAHLLAIPTGN